MNKLKTNNWLSKNETVLMALEFNLLDMVNSTVINY